MAFGERILGTALDDRNDWNYIPESGKLTINKEAMLRSKLKIETMQFHMSRLHPQQWGDRQQIGLKNDFSQLSEDERIKRAVALIATIRGAFLAAAIAAAAEVCAGGARGRVGAGRHGRIAPVSYARPIRDRSPTGEIRFEL